MSRTVLVSFVAFLVIGSPTFTAAQTTLEATRVLTGPVLDGKVDPVWAQGKAITIPVSGGTAGDRDVTVRALYTDREIFFLFQ